ncbi:MAG: Dot/Icm T4SS effector Wip [Legionellales bacterium]
MPHRFSINTDLDRLPDLHEFSELSQSKIQITLGDIHGNAIKLLHILIATKVVTNVTGKQYSHLVQLYNKAPKQLTTGYVTLFNKLLEAIQFSPTVAVRLLGDVLADRGSNDYWTLRLLWKLIQAKVPIEILLSNHDLEFIHAYENQAFFEPNSGMSDSTGPYSSMCNMQTLIDKALITREEVLTMINTIYKPSLKILSYTLDKTTNEITIYSHAPIDLNTIARLAKFFEVAYKDDTIYDLAKTIDLIQKQFAIDVQNNRVSSAENKSNAAFMDVMHNRVYDLLETPTTAYPVSFIHGHTDKTSDVHPNIQSLNSTLGKPNNRKGEFDFCIGVGDLQLCDLDASEVERLTKVTQAIDSTTSLGTAAGVAAADVDSETSLSAAATEMVVVDADKKPAVKTDALSRTRFFTEEPSHAKKPQTRLSLPAHGTPEHHTKPGN